MTPKDKEAYCAKVNRHMQFYDKTLNLTPDNVTSNTQLRDAFKLGSNSLLGKLSQDADMDEQVFLSNQEDLDRLFYDVSHELVDVTPVSDYVVQARVKRRTGYNHANMKGSVILGSYVTSAARIDMYKWFKVCLDHGATLYYTDTDSMILSMKKDQTLPLPFGNAYGEFKHEVTGNIKYFYSLGPKNYSMLIENPDGSNYHITKARGFFLKNDLAAKEVNLQTFKHFIEQLLEQEQKVVRHVPQFRIRCEKSSRQLFSELSVKKFANDTYNKRVFFTGDQYTMFTMPYGYTQNMLDRKMLLL